jgi:hypothetical protein
MSETAQRPPEVGAVGISLVVIGAVGALSVVRALLLHVVAPFVTNRVVEARLGAMVCLHLLLAIVPGLAGALLLAGHSSARAWIVCGALLVLSGIVMNPAHLVEIWRELQVASGLFSAWRPISSLASIVAWTLAFLLVSGRGRTWLSETTRWQWAVAAGTIAVVYGSQLALVALGE